MMSSPYGLSPRKEKRHACRMQRVNLHQRKDGCSAVLTSWHEQRKLALIQFHLIYSVCFSLITSWTFRNATVSLVSLTWLHQALILKSRINSKPDEHFLGLPAQPISKTEAHIGRSNILLWFEATRRLCRHQLVKFRHIIEALIESPSFNLQPWKDFLYHYELDIRFSHRNW